MEDFKGWVKEKTDQAQQGGEETWDKLEDLIKQIPGGQMVLAASPDLQKYTDALKNKAPEVQKVAEEAINDIINVLKQKGAKLEELGKETKDDVQKK